MVESARRRVMGSWDDTVDRFLDGGPAVPPQLGPWAASYRGTGRGAVSFETIPEPFLGPLLGQDVRGVFLALNPGRVYPEFQQRDSVFAREIAAFGSYSRWAESWPYLRPPWTTLVGKNRHHAGRLAFVRNWCGDASLTPTAMVGMELYPWHSTSVTAPLRPDPDVVREWIWEPVAELGKPVFAFGAPWCKILDQLGLEVVARLGTGGTDYGSAVPSRTVHVYREGASGVVVVAERHAGSAGPPSRPETVRLRNVIDAIKPWSEAPQEDRPADGGRDADPLT